MEKVAVSGVAYDKNQSKITVTSVPDKPGVAAQLFQAIAGAHIVVDMIVQNISSDGKETDISFTVPKSDNRKALKITEEIVSELGAKDVKLRDDIAKISVVGVGMRTHSGVAAKMFGTLAQHRINIMMISTSEIKVSCIIDSKYTELAVRVLHDAFDLGVGKKGKGKSKGYQYPFDFNNAKTMRRIEIYDTTWRDGAQTEGISFSVEDKIRISEKLAELGIHYIEGGWPGSNPRDLEYFRKVKKLKLGTSRIVAFGSTHRPKHKVSDDAMFRSLLEADVRLITIFGKSWDFHVREALKISLQENLDIIYNSVAYLKKHVETVFCDAERTTWVAPREPLS